MVLFVSTATPTPYLQTSGGPAPALNKNIGMAYVPMSMSAPGEEFDIQIRNRTARAKLIPLPFYKRAK